jgi:hypothetical protein
MKESPYTSDPSRLANVIAAIQVMAAYKFYKLSFEDWADRICGDKARSLEWETVFIEHPEFFRLDQERKKASLVWRRNFPKSYNVDTKEHVTKEQLIAMNDAERDRISRTPLANDDITALIRSAIELHESALRLKESRRWWVTILVTLLGMSLGLVPYLIEKLT